MTYEQRQVLLDTQRKTEVILQKIMRGRTGDELSLEEFASSRYWQGKLAGIEDILRILGCII